MRIAHLRNACLSLSMAWCHSKPKSISFGLGLSPDSPKPRRNNRKRRACDWQSQSRRFLGAFNGVSNILPGFFFIPTPRNKKFIRYSRTRTSFAFLPVQKYRHPVFTKLLPQFCSIPSNLTTHRQKSAHNNKPGTRQHSKLSFFLFLFLGRFQGERTSPKTQKKIDPSSGQSPNYRIKLKL